MGNEKLLKGVFIFYFYKPIKLDFLKNSYIPRLYPSKRVFSNPGKPYDSSGNILMLVSALLLTEI